MDGKARRGAGRGDRGTDGRMACTELTGMDGRAALGLLGQTDGQADGRAYGRMVCTGLTGMGGTSERTDGWADRPTDGWTDGRTDLRTGWTP